MIPQRTLIAGCGDLGSRIGTRLVDDHNPVVGLRRSAVTDRDGISMIAADMTKPESLSGIGGFHTLIFCPTPDRHDNAGYQRTYVDGLNNILAATQPERLLMVSSTSVYAQSDGSWVNEESTTCPTRFNGQTLLRAETLASGYHGQSTIVRLSGICGPGRNRLLDRVKAGIGEVQYDPVYWTNRIHVDDAADLVVHLLKLNSAPDVIIGVDDVPAPRFEAVEWLARQLDAPPPIRQKLAADHSRNKRLSNARARSLGWSPTYSDYRQSWQSQIIT